MKLPLMDHFSADFIFTCKLYKIDLKDAAYDIILHLDYWFTRKRGLHVHVFPYISLCKMKRPLVGPFFGRILFLCAKFTNHVTRMLYLQYQSIWTASS